MSKKLKYKFIDKYGFERITDEIVGDKRAMTVDMPILGHGMLHFELDGSDDKHLIYKQVT